MYIISILLFIAVAIFVLNFIFKKASGNSSLFSLLKTAPADAVGNEHIPNGLLATATVISAKNNGRVGSVGDMKSWHFQLLIEADVSNGTETWRATIRHQGRDYEINIYQPRFTFSIIYDPNDKSRVIVGNKPASSSAFDLFDVNNLKKFSNQDIMNLTRPDYQNFLRQSQISTALFNELSTTGISAKAVVIQKDLIIAGFSPGADAVKVTIEVSLPGSEKFESEYYILCNQNEENKFTPGNEVNIRYDANNLHKVAICE